MDHSRLKQPELPSSTPMSLAGQTKVSHSYVYGINKVSTLSSKTVMARSSSEPGYNSPKESPDFDGEVTAFYNDDANIQNYYQQQTPPLKGTISGHNKSIVMDEKHINKLIQKLPASLRESVSSIVNIAINYASSAVHSTELLKHEVSALKSDNKKKSHEIDELVKKCDLYKKKVDAVDDHIQGLKDNISLKDNFALKNKQAITKLAKTNRMLIAALESIDNKSMPNLNEDAVNKDVDLNKPRPVMLLPISTNAPPVIPTTNQNLLAQMHMHGVSLPLLQVEQKPTTPGAPSTFGSVMIPNAYQAQMARAGNENLNKYGSMFLTRKEQEEVEKKESEKPVEESDKLRSTLLSVVREHIKTIKTHEIMDKELTEARATVKGALRLNKQLKVENDDLKALKADGENPLSAEGGNLEDFPIVNKKKYFNKVDERFKVLIERGSVETPDLLLKLRRIIGHMVQAPATLDISDLLQFITHGETCKVFEVEMINVFLLRHDASGQSMAKYNTRSTEPEVFDIEGARSVALDVIRLGKTARLNSLARILHYKAAVDGVPGLVVRRMMSIALKGGGKTIGCVHFLNREKTPFTEADELVAMIFADFLNAHIQNCYHHKQQVEKDDMLQHIMTAPQKLCQFVPSRKSLSSIKSLQMSEILSALEHVISETMKCTSVRVFVNSLFNQREEPGFMITFESSDSVTEKDILKKRMLPTRSIAMTSGVSGLVMTTQGPHICSGADASLNPYIDLDPTYSDSPMVTLPMKSYDGEVIAVIQMILSGSQKLGPAEDDQIMGDRGVRKLYFVEAAEMLLENLVGPSLELLSIFNDNVRTAAMTEAEKFNNMMTSRNSMSSVLNGKPNRSTSLSRTSSFESIGNAKVATFNEEVLATAAAETSNLRSELDQLIARTKDEKSSLEMTISQLTEAEKVAVALSVSKSEEAKNALADKERVFAEKERTASENKKLIAEIETLKSVAAVAAAKAPAVEAPANEKASVDDQSEALAKLQLDATQFQRQLTEVSEALASRNVMMSKLEKEIAELKASNESTAKLVSDKEYIIKVLQDQVVKMAENAAPSPARVDAVDDNSNLSIIALGGSDGGANMSSTTGANVDANWVDHVDENGNKYYYNSVTGETSWEKGGRGGGGDSIASSLTAGGEWIQLQGENGETYYFNSLTNETSWDPPVE